MTRPQWLLVGFIGLIAALASSPDTPPMNTRMLAAMAMRPAICSQTLRTS